MKYEMTRKYTTIERVTVIANSMEEAVELVEDDDKDVTIIGEIEGTFEVDYSTIKKTGEA